MEENDFAPGDWELNFYPNGRMNVDLRAESGFEDYCSGSWAHDPVAGYILFDPEEESDDEEADDIPLKSSVGMIFDLEDDGPWLYFFDDGPDVRPDRESIIAHHAHERHKLQYLV